jgi:4-carboxymuconolactone decarboxylase
LLGGGMTDMTERGLQVFAEIMGEDAASGMKAAMASGEFGADIATLATDFAFGRVWGRAGLDRKQRSLVTIGILIAQRQTAELRNHVRIGVTNGLTARELEEVLIQAIPYAGFPAVASAMTAVLETLRELGMDTTSTTSEERGLL